MAAPKWKTPKGNLGTIQEQEYYELTLQAIVPDDSAPLLNFKIIAGSLPPGLVLNTDTGQLNGRAKEQYRVRGVSRNVAEDTTTLFCCRVTNLRTNQVADRTFSLTVTGQDAPTIISNVEELGHVLDGNYAEFQITAIDLDSDPLTYYITNGSLPDGLSLDKNTGIISGFVQPTGFLTDPNAGWSTESGWDLSPWDFYARTISKRFEFDINVTDGKDTVSKKFGIYVISKDSLTADNDIVTVNGYYDVVTADLDNKRLPVLTSLEQDLGIYTHDNYFAYQFKAVDYDLDAVSFSILITENIGFDNEIGGFDSTLLDVGNFELPPSLTLSTETGWLYGNIISMPGIQKEYEFGVYVYKRDYPEYKSRLRNFKMTVVGDLRYSINWLSPTDLGTIVAGNVSELAIEATTSFNKTLMYTLQNGTRSRLPQGLRLLDNGLIAGRASFEVTCFDHNTLTFDKTLRETGDYSPETTYDRTYVFTVKVNDIDNTVTAYKTFKIKVLSEYNRPYETLYLRAQPGLADKEIYNQVVYNTDIIPNEYVYRLGDPFYGKQNNLEVLVLSGINPSEAREYIEAMVINHYRKKLLIGEPKIARALDDNGNVKYEVLYLPMKDDNATVAKSVNLIQKIKRHVTLDRLSPSMDLTYFTVDGYDKIVYPNALRSMRTQIRDSLGYVDREVLPTWMTSKQEDGHIPYWTPAMVLAYLKPGTGQKVKFLLNRLFEYDLKDISFEVDRYVWDCNMSSVYNAVTNTYLDSHITSFDAELRLHDDTLVFSFEGDGSSTSFRLATPLSSRQSQTIAFTSTAPINPTIGDTYSPTAVATSGLPVTLTVDLTSSAIAEFVSARSYATITFHWTTDGGSDIDTMTQIIEPFVSEYVGWTATTGPGPYANTSMPDKDTVYSDTQKIMRWLGDPGPLGPEVVIIDLEAFRQEYPTDATPLTLSLHSNWYGTPITGDMSVTVEVFAGGTLDVNLNPIVAGTVISTDTYSFNVTSNSASAVLGQFLQNISINAYGGSTLSIIGKGTCIINANQAGDSQWDAAPQAQQTFEILGCTDCFIPSTNAIPTYFNYSTTGVLGDAHSISEPGYDTNPILNSCFDWVKRECHQFVWSNDNKIWCITLDADTYAEKRRCSSVNISTILDTPSLSGTGVAAQIYASAKCPNTNWIILSLSADMLIDGATTLTYNTVTGAIQKHDARTYPATLDAIDGYTTPSSNGLNWGSIIWAKQLGTAGTKSLACLRINENSAINVIEKAGYALFIVDNTTGAIDCIAYGDFGEPKSAYWAEGESANGSCIPTEVGTDYTEFVYTAPKLWSGVDYVPEHWGNNAWLTANAVEVPLSLFETYVYKVRVTTSGVITYNLLTHLQGTTVDGPTHPSGTATITGPIMQKDKSIDCVMLYNEIENSVVFVVSKYHLYFFTGDPVLRYAPVSSGGDLSMQSFRGTSLYKINLATGSFTVTEDPNGMISPFGWNDFLQHNTAEPLLLGYQLTVVPNVAEAWYDYSVVEEAGIWKLDGYSLQSSEWIPNPGPLTVPANYFGVYGQSFFLDWPNCQVFLPTVDVTTWPTPPYTRWEILKFGGTSVIDITADEGNDAQVSITLDAIVYPISVEYVVTGVDADSLAVVTFHDENSHSLEVPNLRNGTYTIDISSFSNTLVTASIVVSDIFGNSALGIGDTATPIPPSYAIIDITSPTTESFEILSQVITQDTINVAPVSISNWVGEDSTSFGNTDGPDIYIGATRVARWGGNATAGQQSVYVDLVALATVNPGATPYHWFQFRAKLLAATDNVRLDISVRTYAGGTINNTTLQPTVPGFLIQTNEFITSVLVVDTNPILGDYIFRAGIDPTDGTTSKYTSEMVTHPLYVYDSQVYSATQSATSAVLDISVLPSNATFNYQTKVKHLLWEGFYHVFPTVSNGDPALYGNDVPTTINGYTNTNGQTYHLTNTGWAPFTGFESWAGSRTLDGVPVDFTFSGPAPALSIPGPWTWTNVGGGHFFDADGHYNEYPHSRFRADIGSDLAYNISGVNDVPGRPGRKFKKYSENGIRVEQMSWHVTTTPLKYADPSSFGYVFFGAVSYVAEYGDWDVAPGSEFDWTTIFNGVEYGPGSYKRAAQIIGTRSEPVTNTVSIHGGTPTELPKNLWMLLRVEPA